MMRAVEQGLSTAGASLNTATYTNKNGGSTAANLADFKADVKSGVKVDYRQFNTEEINTLKTQAAKFASQQNISQEKALRALTVSQAVKIDNGWNTAYGVLASENELYKNAANFITKQKQNGEISADQFEATEAEKADTFQNLDVFKANLGFYGVNLDKDVGFVKFVEGVGKGFIAGLYQNAQDLFEAAQDGATSIAGVKFDTQTFSKAVDVVDAKIGDIASKDLSDVGESLNEVLDEFYKSELELMMGDVESATKRDTIVISSLGIAGAAKKAGTKAALDGGDSGGLNGGKFDTASESKFENEKSTDYAGSNVNAYDNGGGFGSFSVNGNGENIANRNIAGGSNRNDNGNSLNNENVVSVGSGDGLNTQNTQGATNTPNTPNTLELSSTTNTPKTPSVVSQPGVSNTPSATNQPNVIDVSGTANTLELSGTFSTSNKQNFFTKGSYLAPSGINYMVFRQEIDWGMVVADKKGVTMTNLEWAKLGNTPTIYINGEFRKINLHHSNQNALGPLFELSNTTHSKFGNTNALHPYKVNGEKVHPYNPVNRTIFNKDRDNYWKDRANEAERFMNQNKDQK